ncbi:MAG: oligoendopeptidase F [Bacteroidetes bacterium QS_8_64_10]|nr:MAG: oligoendopeptidase F [Bacteroidetes bacterium QS_8_64_10]
MEATQTRADDVRWKLDDLYESESAMRDDLGAAQREAEQLSETYRGRVADLSAAQLAEALDELEAVQDRAGRAYTFAYLRWSTDTNDPERGALLQHVKEAYTQIEQQLIFFETEWAEAPEEHAEKLIESDELAGYEHFLEVERLKKDYLLTEPEEKILSEKNVTGRSAWNRYFDETMGAARFELNGDELTRQEILKKLYEPDRDLRRRAALAFTDGLEDHERTLMFVFNTTLADKASDDRLRGYGRYDLVARFYDLKRRLLGLDDLKDYDRYAPLSDADTRYEWDDARGIVLDAYGDFHPQMAEVAGRFFDDGWIDAPLAPGKRGGAFSHGAVPSAHPYVLLNYTGKPRDVRTLAHELGHGVHQFLAREQGVLQASTPLTTAETASVFGEMLVFQRLLRREDDPQNRLAMLVSKIDDTMATVFRQTALNRFENKIHTARREEGELTSERFAEAWMETQRAMFAGSVTLEDHYRRWWSYIPHFLHTPGYVYAYAFGELLVLALYTEYERTGDGFSERYLDLLAAGGSDWPRALVGRFGLDLTDADFWQQGLDAIEELIDDAEKLAEKTATPI